MHQHLGQPLLSNEAAAQMTLVGCPTRDPHPEGPYTAAGADTWAGAEILVPAVAVAPAECNAIDLEEVHPEWT